MKKRFFWGDIHGCYEELKILYYRLFKLYPYAEHWHVGDLVDRGPDSGKVIAFVMQHFTGGIKGNHEDSIAALYLKYKKSGYNPSALPANPDKRRTIEQMNDEMYHYIDSLPPMHVFDDIELVIVHGGLYPFIPLYEQVKWKNICRLQMIKPNALTMKHTQNRWFGPTANKQPGVHKTEEESRAEGYVPWYEVYDHNYACIYGHSVLGLKPFIWKNEWAGPTIGIDTGSCFGGFLTAYEYPSNKYYQEPCKEYVHGKNVTAMKEEL